MKGFKVAMDTEKGFDSLDHIFFMSVLKKFCFGENFMGWTETVKKIKNFVLLTLPVPIPDEEKKLIEIFIFTLLCGTSKGYMTALKALIKPFEAPQRSVKIKI